MKQLGKYYKIHERKVVMVCEVCNFIHEVEESKVEVKGTDWDWMKIPKPQYCPQCKGLTKHSKLSETIEKVEFT